MKEEIMEHKNHAPPLQGAAASRKGQEYREQWPIILEEVKQFGADEVRKKRGIPESTWHGWLKKRPDLAAIVNGNGHKPELRPMPDYLKAADKEQDRAARQEMMAKTCSVADAMLTMLTMADEFEAKAKVLREAAAVLGVA